MAPRSDESLDSPPVASRGSAEEGLSALVTNRPDSFPTLGRATGMADGGVGAAAASETERPNVVRLARTGIRDSEVWGTRGGAAAAGWGSSGCCCSWMGEVGRLVAQVAVVVVVVKPAEVSLASSETRERQKDTNRNPLRHHTRKIN